MDLQEIKEKVVYNFDKIQKDVNNDNLLAEYLSLIIIGQDYAQLKYAAGYFICAYFINRGKHDIEESLALAAKEYLTLLLTLKNES